MSPKMFMFRMGLILYVGLKTLDKTPKGGAPHIVVRFKGYDYED